MTSIITNIGALSAVQTMQKTQSSLQVTQSRVGTGLKVYDASQNAARWSTGTSMKADKGSFSAAYDVHKVARAAVDVALKALNEMGEIAEKIQAKQTELQGSGDPDGALAAEVTELQSAMSDIAGAAEFNGVNLLGSGTYTVAQTSSTTYAITGVAAPTDVATVKTAAQTLGAAAQRLDAYAGFAKAMEKGLQAGHGALLDADMGEESARMSALQVQQQLSAQALSIANQSAQTVLSAFR